MWEENYWNIHKKPSSIRRKTTETLRDPALNTHRFRCAQLVQEMKSNAATKQETELKTQNKSIHQKMLEMIPELVRVWSFLSYQWRPAFTDWLYCCCYQHTCQTREELLSCCLFCETAVM